MMIFVMDVMFIYTTMWTAGSGQTETLKESQANFYGINYGVFYLVIFTFVYYGNLVPALDTKSKFGFKLISTISAIQCNFSEIIIQLCYVSGLANQGYSCL